MIGGGGGWNWDEWFLGMAEYVSKASKDPSTKVGVVIIDDQRRVLGVGYNGFPRGVKDTAERLNDRPSKLSRVVHAELNAILNCAHRPEGATLYLHPGCPPCNECAKAVIQAGIKRVVGRPFPHDRWTESCAIAAEMCREAGVQIDIINEVAA